MKAYGEMVMSKIKTLKPLSKTVVAEVVFKKSSIVILEKNNNNNKSLDKIIVHAVGEEVEKVKNGDDILLPINILSRPDYRLELPEEKKDALFLVFQEDDILGIYN